jgi:hypothetical protein
MKHVKLNKVAKPAKGDRVIYISNEPANKPVAEDELYLVFANTEPYVLLPGQEPDWFKEGEEPDWCSEDDVIEAVGFLMVDDSAADVTIKIQSLATTSTKCPRALAFYLGLLVANGEEPREALEHLVLVNKSVLPNYWIVSLFDFLLDQEGKLLSVLEEVIATNQIVLKNGRMIECQY